MRSRFRLCSQLHFSVCGRPSTTRFPSTRTSPAVLLTNVLLLEPEEVPKPELASVALLLMTRLLLAFRNSTPNQL